MLGGAFQFPVVADPPPAPSEVGSENLLWRVCEGAGDVGLGNESLREGGGAEADPPAAPP